jgi:general secretion pathway protein L
MNLSVVTDFCAWWSGQIMDLVPTIDQRTLANRLSKTEIHLSRDGARLVRNQRLKKTISLQTQATKFQNIEHAVNLFRAREKVILSFDDSLCFVRDTMIPLAALNRAGDILNLELMRVSPLKKNDIFSVWFPNGTNNHGKIGLTHVIVRRDVVKSTIDLLARRKIAVAAVAFRNQNRSAAPVVLDENGLRFGSRREVFWRRIAALAGTLLPVAALVLSWQWMMRIQEDLKLSNDRLQSIQASATANKKTIDKKQNLTRSFAELQKLKQQGIGLIEIWRELSKIIPDSAWLQSFSQKNGIVLLEGTASDAESLIQILETSDLFHDVRFVSPVVKNPGEEKVRFSISMNLGGSSE